MVLVSSREAKPGARTQRAQDTQRAQGKRARPAAGGTPAKSSRASGVGREKVSEIQRARILAAMTEVAAERGAGNVTVAHVVSRSGVSRRTFYELFDDREACFLAAFDDALQRIAARVVGAYGSATHPHSRTGPHSGTTNRGGHPKGHPPSRGTGRQAGWRDRIRGGLAELLEFLDEEPQVGRLCIVESLAAGPRALERRARIVADLKEALEEGRAELKATPPPMTAEGVVGAVSSVLHARLAEPAPRRGTGTSGSAAGSGSEGFAELLGPLMGMIVLPYQGAAAAARELERPRPARPARPRATGRDPLRELDMRLTYRTVRVLLAIAQAPGASNREVAEASDVEDQGQISKLLSRLKTLGLIENAGAGHLSGEPNAWHLTAKGERVAGAIQVQTAG
jgi:AcrR family transcriptional regulator